MIKVKWLKYDKADRMNVPDLGGLGGLPFSITLDEYIDQYYKKSQKYILAIINDIKTNQYVFGGDYHQQGDYGCPVVYENNKPVKKMTCSYRAWGDFMHCIYVDKPDCVMGYMDFYMDKLVKDNTMLELKYPGVKR